MRRELKKLPINGTVVIGEGEWDEAPMLFIGEKVGTGGHLGARGSRYSWSLRGAVRTGREFRDGSIATGRGKLQVQPRPQCPVSDARPTQCNKSRWAKNGHSRNTEAPFTPRKPSEFPCTSVRASSASQRAQLRKKVRPYNAAE